MSDHTVGTIVGTTHMVGTIGGTIVGTIVDTSRYFICPIVGTILCSIVGILSNTWVLMIAGRQARQPDVR